MTDTTRTGLPPAAPLRPEGLRLIAVDMDGTFLGAGMPGTYDRARFAPLRRRMRERGVRFVVASGNQEHQIAGYFEGKEGGVALRPDGIVSDNGAIVTAFDAAGHQRLLESAMPPEALGAALAVLADYPDIGVIGSGPRGAVVPEDQDPELRELLVRYHTRFRLVPDRAHIAGHRVAKLAIVDPRGLDPALPARLDAALGATVTAVTSGHESIDIIVTGRHKASGLDLLLDHWGLGREQVAAFGDSVNDVELLRCAGIGVAVANASPEAVAAADYRAPANTEAGVLAVLESWFAEEGSAP